MARETKMESHYASLDALVRRLPAAEKYVVALESDSGYRAYFQFNTTGARKHFVDEVLIAPRLANWMGRLAMDLGEDVRAYVMPWSVRFGGVDKWAPLEAEATRVHFKTCHFVANGGALPDRKGAVKAAKEAVKAAS